MPQPVQPPVRFTQRALDQLQNLRTQFHVQPEMIVRLGIKGGGCARVEYMMAFDQAAGTDDIYIIEGQKVAIAKKDAMHILGMIVDWENAENSKGFIFLNPLEVDNHDLNSG